MAVKKLPVKPKPAVGVGGQKGRSIAGEIARRKIVDRARRRGRGRIGGQ